MKTILDKYEIISFKQNSGVTDLWTWFGTISRGGYARNYKGNRSTTTLSLSTILNRTDMYRIYSIKRLSDGQIFTIGDNYELHRNKYIIKSFTYTSVGVSVQPIEGMSCGLPYIKKCNMEKTITLSIEQARKMYGKSKEMDELLLANFTKEEFTEPVLPNSWKNIPCIEGYYLTTWGSIQKGHGSTSNHEGLENRFATKAQAKSASAMAQLSQLMKAYNEDWTPNWVDDSAIYIIEGYKKIIRVDFYYHKYQFLAFKTSYLRDKFLENFEDLIKDYFMIS